MSLRIFTKTGSCRCYFIKQVTSLLKNIQTPNSHIFRLSSSLYSSSTPHHGILYNLNFVRTMAGHAKWQNIAHTKSARDNEKAKVFSKFVVMIKKACAEGGSTNPKLNSKLANVLVEAKANNVSQSTIDNTFKRIENKKLKSAMFEVIAPGGCLLLVDVECEAENICKHDIKIVCRKSNVGARLSETPKANSFYIKKGVITSSTLINGEPVNNEKALDDAILAGAEEVKPSQQDEKIIEFICEPADLFAVKKVLETDYVISEAAVVYVPFRKVAINEADMTATSQLIASLQQLPDVIKIYDNIE